MKNDIKRKAQKPCPIHLRVQRGYLEPSDSFTASQLRAKGYSVGDDINLPQACGTEAQWMFAMLSYLHGAWSVKRIGLLAPTVGPEIGTGNSGEIDLGTPV